MERRVTGGSRNYVALPEMGLDGIGSAVGKLVSEALRVIAVEASSPGYDVIAPVSPGMPCFALAEQRNPPL